MADLALSRAIGTAETQAAHVATKHRRSSGYGLPWAHGKHISLLTRRNRVLETMETAKSSCLSQG